MKESSSCTFWLSSDIACFVSLGIALKVFSSRETRRPSIDIISRRFASKWSLIVCSLPRTLSGVCATGGAERMRAFARAPRALAVCLVFSCHGGTTSCRLGIWYRGRETTSIYISAKTLRT